MGLNHANPELKERNGDENTHVLCLPKKKQVTKIFISLDSKK